MEQTGNTYVESDISKKKGEVVRYDKVELIPVRDHLYMNYDNKKLYVHYNYSFLDVFL